MLCGTIDHGALLRIVGHPRKAVQYVVGNPLYAIEMTRHTIGAALYALRVLIYEDDGGKTCIEYDRPSSLFGQFGDTRVTRRRPRSTANSPTWRQRRCAEGLSQAQHELRALAASDHRIIKSRNGSTWRTRINSARNSSSTSTICTLGNDSSATRA
ncbi:MAG: DUF302 domain-containing protein [Gammaproteobacteria bacterium]